MISIAYQFGHPFDGRVILRRLGTADSEECSLFFDSKGALNFEVPLPIHQDGSYRVTLDWIYEGRLFFHQSDIRVKSGQLLSD
ncbi:MAG: hypothetical protein V4520_00075 [Bacteroidota bacterium]